MMCSRNVANENASLDATEFGSGAAKADACRPCPGCTMLTAANPSSIAIVLTTSK
jgi:hypothetical protein